MGWATLLTMGQVTDVLSTMIGISMGFSEANPLVNRMGWGTTASLKILLCVLFYLFFWRFKDMPRWRLNVTGLLLGAITWFAPISNLVKILEAT